MLTGLLLLMAVCGLTACSQDDTLDEESWSGGLQVMGLLETRTLDFKNVIMLSVNEGVLPAGISFNSLIPFDFKFAGESLENYLYKDQVYAYHFFRLLQRAENVVLVYDQNGDSLSEKPTNSIITKQVICAPKRMPWTVYLSFFSINACCRTFFSFPLR